MSQLILTRIADAHNTVHCTRPKLKGIVPTNQYRMPQRATAKNSNGISVIKNHDETILFVGYGNMLGFGMISLAEIFWLHISGFCSEFCCLLRKFSC